MLEPTPSQPREDLPTLTALRFVAAFMIYVLHFSQFAPAYAKYVNPAALNQGVSFFFVLSGFVLTHAYGQRAVDVRSFLRARFARLYPTHLATLVLVMAVLPFAAARFQNLSPTMTVVSLLAKLTMLDCWLPIGGVARAWNYVSWSISTEFFFYLAFPLLLPWIKRDWPLTLALSFLCMLAVYATGVRLGWSPIDHGYTTPTLYHLATMNPLSRGFEFVLGMATYQVFAHRIAPLSLSRGRWTAIEAAVCVVTGLWLILAVPAINRHTDGAFDVWFASSGSVWVVALLILAVARGQGAIGAALSHPLLVRLGEASFAFYMVHAVCLRILRQFLGEQLPPVPSLAFALLTAFAMMQWVEKPMRDRLLAGRSPRAKAVAA